ncbi:MAG: hypothetical protein K5869_02955 [Saccharofermentans sp.]|nr:hypothetical protein [Saccharofermentans sp.]
MKKAVTIPFRTFWALSLGFLVLPVIIFFTGYLRPLAGIPIALLFVFAYAMSIRDCTSDQKKVQLSKDSTAIKIPLGYLIGFAVTAVLLSLVSGIGEFIFTLNDHPYRRAIMNDLVNYKWPVIYDYSTQTNPEVISLIGRTSGTYAFMYYFTYWLPAALAGKIAGSFAANLTLMLWSALGIFLTFVGVSKIIGRASFTVPFAYICFAGLDVIPNVFHNFMDWDAWNGMEVWAPQLAYMSNFAELTSVFHQCIPCWLIMTLVLMSYNTRSLGLAGGIMLTYSPWGVIGLFPLVLVRIFSKPMREGGTGKVLKNLFSFTNIIPCVLLVAVYGPFYLGNHSSTMIKGFFWEFMDNPALAPVVYVVFILIEVVPIALILWKTEKKNIMFIAAIAELLIIPVYKVSEVNDFCMRSSMAARFVLCVLLARYLKDLYDADKIIVQKKLKRKKKDVIKLAFAMLTVILMIYPSFVMAYYVLGSEFTGADHNAEEIGSFGNIRQSEHTWNVTHNYISSNYEETFFFKYLAKKQDNG